MFAALWAEFDAAKALSASTKKKWEPYFAQLIKRVGTDDRSRVTEQHLLDWRDALLATKLSPITVRDGYIASAGTFVGWTKKMKKLPYGPSAEVFVEISEKHETEMRGFDHQEAATILAAALAPPNGFMTEENAGARRWVPWPCVCTGARVNEITQLRACDVVTFESIERIRITPRGGDREDQPEAHRPAASTPEGMGFVERARWKKGGPRRCSTR
ncbi:integrase [Bradyrhizobium sp. USDA 4501]